MLATGSAGSVEAAVNITQPELPRVFIDSSYPALSASRTVRYVESDCKSISNCYSSLQTAIDEASLGDEIVVKAGMTITGPIKLKNKTSGNGWIVIRTSNLDNLPSAGQRVNPSHASLMPKIVSPGKNQNALNAEHGAHHYRIVGIEFSKSSPSAAENNLIYLGLDAMTSLSEVPHHIVFDRVYAHGDPTSNLRRCMTLNTTWTAVIDSHLSDCHEAGADAQAIGVWNGPGPFKIVNNYLEASGENIMFGGSDPKIQNLVSEDIEIRGNHFYKPLSWKIGHATYAGHPWTVKNLFETKNARRVLVDGNVFENSWTHGQTGTGILLKSANQDGGCTWCSNEDITFTNNIVRNVEQGLTINGAEGQLPLPRQSTRIKIKNNLFENVSARLFQVYNGATHIQFENNTGYSKYSILFGNPGPNANLVFRNNIVERSTYGIGTGADEGKIYLDKWFSPYVFENNVVLNVSQGTSQQVSDETLLKRYPAGTEVVTGRNLTGIDKGIGADMDAINEATRWVATGAGTIANSAPVQTIVTPPTPVVSNPIPAPVTVTLPEQAAPQASSGSSNSSGRGGGGGGSSSSISNRSNAPAANSAIIMAIQVQLITLIQQLIVMLNQQIQAMHAGNNY